MSSFILKNQARFQLFREQTLQKPSDDRKYTRPATVHLVKSKEECSCIDSRERSMYQDAGNQPQDSC